MKRLLVVLAILVLPLSAMAMTPISDNDMSAVTGQAGVTIDIGNMNIEMSLGTITWGDVDGLDANTANAGYVNMCIETVPMHIAIGSLTLSIDVGTYIPQSFTSAFDTASSLANVTAVAIGFTNFTMSMDAFAIHAIVLDGTNGVVVDYLADAAGGGWIPTVQGPIGAPTNASAYLTAYLAADPIETKSLGWFGFSNLQVAINGGTVWIYPH